MRLYRNKKTNECFILHPDRTVDSTDLSKLMKISMQRSICIKDCDYIPEIYSWEGIENLCTKIADHFRPWKPTHISTWPGLGGLAPASIIGYNLAIPFIPYNSLLTLSRNPSLGTTPRILIVDDIYDTGATHHKHRPYLSRTPSSPLFEFAYLFSRWFPPHEGFVARTIITKQFLRFPWAPSDTLKSSLPNSGQS